MHQVKFLWVGLLVLLSLFIASELFAQADVIEKRQKLMKGNGEAAKAVKKAAEEKNYATVETKAKDLMGNSEKIPGLFPQGSTAGKTKALPAIWEKSDDFAKRAKNLGKAASELVDAAKSGDGAAVDVKVKALGDACGGCHKGFRAEKYSE